MKFAKNRTAIVISTLFLITAALLASIPILHGQSTSPTPTPAGTKQTYAFIGATPNPIGVGQETLLHFGITQEYMSMYDGWQGLTVTVVDPTGKVTTLGPFETDPTGGRGYVFVPNMEGNYTLQTHFPQQVNDVAIGAGFGNPLPKGTIMLASVSRNLTLTVQPTPVNIYPTRALPTEYWSRPIDGQLTEWSQVAGNWQRTPDNLVTQGNVDAPETAHILWAKPLTEGGVVGAELGPHAWESGDAYQGKFANSVIMNGILYYNTYPETGAKAAYPIQAIKAVDLRTGEDLWTRNGTRLAFGQELFVNTMNMMGAYGYIWSVTGSTWTAYDSFNGEYVYSMNGVPSGTTVVGPNNEILIYTVNRNGYMTCWNSTTVVNKGDGTWEFGRYWNPFGYNYSASLGYWWNVTCPKGLSGAAYVAVGDKIVGQTITATSVTTWGLSLKPGQEGQLLFNTTWQAPADWYTGNQTISRTAGSIKDGLITVWSKETQQLWGFSTNTGNLLWGPTPAQDYLDMYGIHIYIVDGMVYSQGMSGILYAYNANNGALNWTYTADDYYNQILWANQWNLRPLFFADDKIYMGVSEHSPIDPKSKGGAFVAVDMRNGTEVFRADGLFRQTEWGGRAIIGDSIIATLDTYDERIYAVGKGPSAITVTAPDVSIDFGKSVTIKGTVTDISAGTQDYALAARFPNGVPAVSDESQSAWMLYVYKQFERPTNTTGVDITLSIIDSNNNYREIGTTTSDADGFFSFNWTPDIEGKYTVYASFGGSESYWPSHAVTSFAVDPKAATPTPQPTQPPSNADLYFIPAIAGLLVAIIVVGLLTILTLRKRP